MESNKTNYILVSCVPDQPCYLCNGTSEWWGNNTFLATGFPAETRRWINVGLTLVHRLRRWTKVKPTLIQCLVSAGLHLKLVVNDWDLSNKTIHGYCKLLLKIKNKNSYASESKYCNMTSLYYENLCDSFITMPHRPTYLLNMWKHSS